MGGWRAAGRSVRAVERIDDGTEADERVLDHLARLGSDPSRPCETTHFVYLPREAEASQVAETLRRDGWLTRVDQCVDPGLEGEWLVVAARAIALSSSGVRDTRRRLETLAAQYGGVYDGWEAKANA